MLLKRHQVKWLDYIPVHRHFISLNVILLYLPNGTTFFNATWWGNFYLVIKEKKKSGKVLVNGQLLFYNFIISLDANTALI